MRSPMRPEVLTSCLSRRVLLLDGGIGSELLRRGVAAASRLWGVGALLEAPAEVRRLHADYARAEADLLTAATFRVSPYALRRAGLEARTRELAVLALRLLREGAAEAGRRVLALASVTTLEDCYQPDLVPPDAVLEREHAATVEILAEAGADGLLLETFNTVREATAAARAAVHTGLPVIVSFACRADGRLLSGEDPAQAARAVSLPGVVAVGTNCTSCAAVGGVLRRLASGTTLPLAAWANNGWAGDDSPWLTADRLDPEAYANEALRWCGAGARLVGGCCGTGPAEIAALAAALPRRFQ
ncbi:MAG TPA: homocysteine S-methyltransferase family protein [Thermoanaerobaculaceae bacterium]|nr:homocysteine S-methyltransferase family protein [Thermoanaerobaculaceae bacterium]HRS16473.1 homocysteine S-methyltransferase family protein [Thermoanaerobaculaceae bacterium]